MHEKALEVAIKAATEAGRILRAGLHEEKGARCKDHRHDPVTLFDRLAEEVILARIKRTFPDHGVLSEEGGGEERGSPYRWVIDPLDGTNNYLREYPQFAVSIALQHRQTSLVGCIYDPLREELFTAIRGDGAWLNGKPIRVSSHPSLDGASLGAGFSSRPQRALMTHATLKRLIPHARAIRVAGSACLDLAYVAAGRLDATWYLSLSLWDVAAGVLLIEEARGQVSNLRGESMVDPEAGILATNRLIHAAMIEMLCDEAGLPGDRNCPSKPST